jgi:protein-S-isoprenylcysteine O-methyltransferase Ste14
MIAAPNERSYAELGIDHRNWTSWRGSLGSRTAWKSVCSLCLISYTMYYSSLVLDSVVMMIIGGVWCAKLLCEIWGQETPTWACPNGPGLFVLVYVFGLPSFAWMFGSCRVVDIEMPQRELVGLALYLFGSTCSLGHELHRFNWKAKPENKGKLHTVGLAAYCIHPNYFGDLFTYSGWALASGTKCALSIFPFQFFLMVFFVCPNSDAYLAQRYPSEFPAYAAATATYIPGLHSPALSKGLAWICFAVAIWMEMNCGVACGLA